MAAEQLQTTKRHVNFNGKMRQKKFTALLYAKVSLIYSTKAMKVYVKEYYLSIPFERVSFYLQRAVSQGTKKAPDNPTDCTCVNAVATWMPTVPEVCLETALMHSKISQEF